MTADSATQRITRLTPLDTVRALIEARVKSVTPRKSAVDAARRFTLAKDIWVKWPPTSLALCDGYAVDAALVADAGPYSPIPLPPTTRRVDDSEQLPEGTNAVLPLDAVVTRGDHLEAIAPVAPGDCAWLAGDNPLPDEPLYAAGHQLHAIDLAVLCGAGVEEVTVRAPRIRVALGGNKSDPLARNARLILLRLIGDGGGVVAGGSTAFDDAVIGDANADALVVVGGTGSGRSDNAVRMLERCGQVEVHGIAISPGSSAAFGFAGSRPVLLIPGRLDAVLAVWLLVGRHFLASLAGGTVKDDATTARLGRKISSTIGMAELIPVSCSDQIAQPQASGYLSLTLLARSDGWIVVPADSEGFAAGTPVAVHPWP